MVYKTSALMDDSSAGTGKFAVQPAVFYMQLSGQAHLSVPERMLRGAQVAGIPVLHPADHNPSAVFGFPSSSKKSGHSHIRPKRWLLVHNTFLYFH